MTVGPVSGPPAGGYEMTTIEVIGKLDMHLADRCWRLYYDAFVELNAYAVQRHLMTVREFDEVMTDPTVAKYLARDDAGTLAGLATYTNELHAMPLISPAYFERRWPKLYTEGKIWYCGFVAVAPGSGDAFGALVEAMARVAIDDGGIIALDMCRFNDEGRRLSRVIPLMLHRIAGEVRTERMDDQSYWLYEFPADGRAADHG